ncbi:MAG: TIGR00296 family protein [Candidatus Baldrarchaeia archaeon]
MYTYSLEEGEFLVKLARKSVETYVKEKRRISVPKDVPEKLKQKAGVFVTLNKIIEVEQHKTTLRGCIGYPYPTLPLVEATIDAAIQAAVNDPRFPPVTETELDKILVEVSVLTPPKLIEVDDPKEYPKKIKIGRDGLIVESGFFKGLLLPQVPIEWKWNEEEFLSHCCMKAGLTPDCWLEKDVKIYSFQAEIFEEESPRGPIKRKEIS